jgi:hypothetical protein
VPERVDADGNILQARCPRPAVKRNYGVILKRDGRVDSKATREQRKL